MKILIRVVILCWFVGFCYGDSDFNKVYAATLKVYTASGIGSFSACRDGSSVFYDALLGEFKNCRNGDTRRAYDNSNGGIHQGLQSDNYWPYMGDILTCPSCTPACVPSWNWGSCSVNCGGGTQSAKDGCGKKKSRKCNNNACPQIPPKKCSGNKLPGAIICHGDNTGLSSSMKWVKVTSCTNTRKCEYTITPKCGNDNNKTFTNRPGSSLCMNTNVFQWTDATANDGTWNWKCGNTANCSANRVFRCTGAYPRNVTVCSGSTTGLTTDAAWNKVDSCRGAGKCTYTARCITGRNQHERPPYGAEWCPNSHKGLVANTLWRKVHRCSGRKCEYIVPAKCGTDHEKSFDTTAELTTSGKYCGVRSVKFDFKDNSGVTDNGGTAWTWGCRRESQIVKCEAYKNGECNDTPKKSPYKQKEYACKVGSFNSVSLGDIDTKPVLTWKCGTGKSKKSNGSPATPKYIGDFFSGNADKAPQVAFDNYTPTSGGVNCKCYPEYSYVCSYSDADCSNKCDGYALSVAVATKHDTECFPAEIKSISKTEFNLNKNSNQEECENKQIKCAACGANSAETGEGGIWHESH